MPYPDEVENGSVLELDITVGEAQLEVRGEVKAADFDELGNVGLRVTLDDPSWEAVKQLETALAGGARAPVLFSTSRLHIDASKSSPDVESSAPAPGDELPEQQIEPGTLIDGRFRVDSHLATGGMGEVYRAEHVHLKRAVALKVLKRSLLADPESWTRFEREAQLVSRLENPHIVRVFDFGRTEEGQLFLAMEYVDGETLDARLARSPLDPRAAVDILSQVLEGLGEAHVLGVVHRDLKPANIILGRRRDGAERAKILDFGIARLSDKATGASTRLTQLGVVVGTPAYLAPEQALADELDHRTDIYALGCVAYELLTGRPPFVAAELRKVVSAHLTQPPEPLEKFRPELSSHALLGAAVLKALAKEKERRFQNVNEFREALIDALARPGVAAPPPEFSPSPVPAAAEVSEWAEAPAVTSSPSAIVQPADDFFSSIGPISAPAAKKAPTSKLLAPFMSVASESALIRLQRATPTEPGRGVAVRFEVLGPQGRTPAEQACLARVLEEVANSGGFLAAVDDEGITVGFIGEGSSPGRAVRTMLAARELVALEGQRQKTPAALRGFASAAVFPSTGEATASLRQRLAKARAGQAWVEVALANRASRLCAFAETETAGVVACGARRPGGFAVAELLGRRPVVDALERRLASLKQGMGVSLLVSGPVRGGATTIGHLLIAGSKKRQFFTARATPESARPYSALTAMLCQAVGLTPEERFSKLEAALEKLFIVEPVREAALAVAGVRAWPSLPTPGQAAHALRVVLRGAAGELPIVAVFDALHLMDQHSFDAFVAMAVRPASRELVVGFTAPSPRAPQLKDLQNVALPALDSAEVSRAANSALRATAGQLLSEWLFTHSRGVAGTVMELLAWLDESGQLIDREGIVEIAQAELEPPEVDVRLARLALLPVLDRLLLQTLASLGPRSDIATVRRASPEATPERLAALQVNGWVLSEGGRQLSVRSHAVREALLTTVGPEIHARCAAALIEQGKLDAASVDYAELAAHLVAAGDGARAAPLWKHALELAVARSDARNASVAWAGMADAMALMPSSDAQARGRVDAMARAAAQSLSVEDVTRAR
ncbi:MAG: protein kinase domain-containing protein, partial [Archangium sp.]